jgi:hypothetical protein
MQSDFSNSRFCEIQKLLGFQGKQHNGTGLTMAQGNTRIYKPKRFSILYWICMHRGPTTEMQTRLAT